MCEGTHALELQFHRAMISIYERARDECNYNATRFLKMVAEQGGLNTARALLGTRELPEGFTALWELGRLDLTMEAMIVENPMWHLLFTEEELATARKRLTDCGYAPRYDSEVEGGACR